MNNYSKLRLLIANLFVIVAGGCSSAGDEGPRSLHPSLGFMESNLGIETVRTGEPESIWEPEYESQLLSFSGNIDGEEATFRSRISQIAKTGDGFIFVDEDRMQVIYMDADSSFHAVGRSGPGPGEYSVPGGITYAGNGRVLVADMMKTELFQIADSGVEPVKTIRTNIDTPSGICLMNDTIYVSGSSVTADFDAMMALMQGEPAENPLALISRPVHAFTGDGETVNSFGNRYASLSGWPTYTAHFSAQYMLCDDSRDIIFTVNQRFPVISAWSAEGEELWSVFLEDIPSLPMNEKSDDRPEMMLAVGAQTFYANARPVMLEDELVLQFHKVMLDENHEFIPVADEQDVRFVFLQPDTGEVIRVKSGNRIMLYATDEIIITDEPNPGKRSLYESGEVLTIFSR